MLDTFIQSLDQLITAMKAHAPIALIIIAILWAIQLVNAALNYRLNALGILPRHPVGLFPGIFTSHFLHGHFNHLFFNSIPLFLLLSLMLTAGFPAFLNISLNIMLFSGLATWLFGRRAFHVGASAVIMGYMGFLLMQAYHQRSAASVVLGIVAFYYCGSILVHLLPSDAKTSWEGHVFGFAAGVAVAMGYGVDFSFILSHFLTK